MRHAMAIVKQDVWDKLWNETPADRRMQPFETEFGPVMVIASAYAHLFVFTSGQCEVIAEKEVEQFLLTAIKFPKDESAYRSSEIRSRQNGVKA
jgi:hypothetical protein